MVCCSFILGTVLFLGQMFKVSLNQSAVCGLQESVAAAKVLHSTHQDFHSEKYSLLQEAIVMTQFNDKNLAHVIGVVTRGTPVILLMSYCELGSLRCVLKKRKELDDVMPPRLKLDMVVSFAIFSHKYDYV